MIFEEDGYKRQLFRGEVLAADDDIKQYETTSTDEGLQLHALLSYMKLVSEQKKKHADKLRTLFYTKSGRDG